MKGSLYFIVLFASCGFCTVAAAQQASSSYYSVEISTIDGGGGSAASTNYTVTSASIGGVYGHASSADYSSDSGYIPQVIALGDAALDLKDYDSWIAQYFTPGSPQAARNFDADGDGISNEDEFYALTAPDDADSYLRFVLVSVLQSPAQVDLQFSPYESDSSLRHYQLLGSSDLSATFSPLDISPVDDYAGGATFQDTQPQPDAYFYQLKITIPE